MNKKAIAGIGLLGLGAIVLTMGKGEQVKRDQLDPKTPTEPDLEQRLKVVNAAIREIGPQNPKKYWDDTVPGYPGFSGAWCGGFALWAIHQAGLAKDVDWEIGKGFCYRLPITKNPLPGDIAYFDNPYQHHAIVESVNNGMVNTIDGNQPGNEVRRRTRDYESVTAFYSIDPYVQADSMQV
jgi:hypothetical protein